MHNLDWFHIVVVKSNSQNKQSNPPIRQFDADIDAREAERARYRELDVPWNTSSALLHVRPRIALHSQSQHLQHLLRGILSQQDGVQECLQDRSVLILTGIYQVSLSFFLERKADTSSKTFSVQCLWCWDPC